MGETVIPEPKESKFIDPCPTEIICGMMTTVCAILGQIACVATTVRRLDKRYDAPAAGTIEAKFDALALERVGDILYSHNALWFAFVVVAMSIVVQWGLMVWMGCIGNDIDEVLQKVRRDLERANNDVTCLKHALVKTKVELEEMTAVKIHETKRDIDINILSAHANVWNDIEDAGVKAEVVASVQRRQFHPVVPVDPARLTVVRAAMQELAAGVQLAAM